MLVNNPLPKIWRLHIKQESHVKVPSRVQFCIENSTIGVGWGVPDGKNGDTWETYCKKSTSVDRNVGRLNSRIVHDDLVWVRDSSGKYWISRVVSDWEYRNGDSFDLADIHNVRLCVWAKVGDTYEIAGKILCSVGTDRSDPNWDFAVF